MDKAAAAAVVSHQINFGLKSGQVFVSVYGDMELVPRASQENELKCSGLCRSTLVVSVCLWETGGIVVMGGVERGWRPFN